MIQDFYPLGIVIFTILGLMTIVNAHSDKVKWIKAINQLKAAHLRERLLSPGAADIRLFEKLGLKLTTYTVSYGNYRVGNSKNKVLFEYCDTQDNSWSFVYLEHSERFYIHVAYRDVKIIRPTPMFSTGGIFLDDILSPQLLHFMQWCYTYDQTTFKQVATNISDNVLLSWIMYHTSPKEVT